VLTTALARSFGNAPFFGGTLASSFTNDGGHVSVKIAAGILVVVMIATTFMTQRQLMAKNMPPDAMTGQYAQQQKMLLYVLPLVFGVGGIAFPIGVLFYWTTSNLWTMGQQFYVIRNNPAPGTPAYAAKQRRHADPAARRGTPAEPVGAPTDAAGATGSTGTERSDRRPAQRQQPRRQSREQRRKATGTGALGGSPPADEPEVADRSGAEGPPTAQGRVRSGQDGDRGGGAARQAPRQVPRQGPGKDKAKNPGRSSGRSKRQTKGENK
jgi:YidC/Oxa1 family membrane protein insertase